MRDQDDVVVDLNPRSKKRWATPREEWPELDDDDDGLRFFQGVVSGLLLSIPLWVLITFAIWWLVRWVYWWVY